MPVNTFLIEAPDSTVRLFRPGVKAGNGPRSNIMLIADRTPRTAARTPMALDDKTRTELEAAAFRRLVSHLRERADVQNIDLMNLAGFCRNCLSNWMKDAADAQGVAMTKDQSREAIYGMPYDEWKAKNQTEASKDQLSKFDKAHKH
jgi:hypothetical protein